MIICKSKVELNLMREAVRIVAETHRLLAEAIRPNVPTKDLDQIAEDYIRSQGTNPSHKRLQRFSRQHLRFSQRTISTRSTWTQAIQTCIEESGFSVKTMEDDWTVVAVDGTICAHFEHTVAITADG
jgi:methionine aminopeptidase